MAETSSKPANPLATVGGIVGILGGWAFSQYAGAALWIPFAATLVLFLIGAKTPLRPKYFAGAICVTAGHIIWFLAACFMTGSWALMALDIIVLMVAVVWLWIRPSLVVALFLGGIQLASLAYNIYMISSHPVGGLVHKALAVHCLWRLIALACLVAGYRKWRRQSQVASASPSMPEAV